MYSELIETLNLIVLRITAYYLFKTFQEQVKINKATLSKHTREIRPHFDAKYDTDSGTYLMKVFNAIALDVSIFSIDNSGNKNDIPTYTFNAFYPIDYGLSMPSTPFINFNVGSVVWFIF